MASPAAASNWGSWATRVAFSLRCSGRGRTVRWRYPAPLRPGLSGHEYELTYRVPGGNPKPDTLKQDAYPLAAGGPVTFTLAGQPVLGTKTTGGWYHAPDTFRPLLTSLGVPGLTATATTPSRPQPTVAGNAENAANAANAGTDGEQPPDAMAGYRVQRHRHLRCRDGPCVASPIVPPEGDVASIAENECRSRRRAAGSMPGAASGGSSSPPSMYSARSARSNGAHSKRT